MPTLRLIHSKHGEVKKKVVNSRQGQKDIIYTWRHCMSKKQWDECELKIDRPFSEKWTRHLKKVKCRKRGIIYESTSHAALYYFLTEQTVRLHCLGKIKDLQKVNFDYV